MDAVSNRAWTKPFLEREEADVSLRLERGKRVAQGARRDALGDSGLFTILVQKVAHTHLLEGFPIAIQEQMVVGGR